MKQSIQNKNSCDKRYDKFHDFWSKQEQENREHHEIPDRRNGTETAISLLNNASFHGPLSPSPIT